MCTCLIIMDVKYSCKFKCLNSEDKQSVRCYLRKEIWVGTWQASIMYYIVCDVNNILLV